MKDLAVLAARIEQHLAGIDTHLEKIEQHLYVATIAQLYQANPSARELRETIMIAQELINHRETQEARV